MVTNIHIIKKDHDVEFKRQFYGRMHYIHGLAINSTRFESAKWREALCNLISFFMFTVILVTGID